MNAPARSDRSLLTEWRRTIDWPILVACAVLIGIGLLAALSAGPPAANRIGYADPYHFVYRQIAFAGAGAMVLICASMLTVKWARRAAAAVFLGAIVLMLIMLVIGYEAKGAQRWIRFAGFSLQPSEFAKPALIVLAGWVFAQREFYPDVPWAAIATALWAGTIGLFLLQPDVGQSALLTAAFLITFFIAGLSWRVAAAFGVGGALLSGLLFLTLPHFRIRLLGFFRPSGYDTYQIDKATEAIGNGGLFGVGPGEGTVKESLPDAHSDFVYAVLSEEFGLVLSLVVLLLYAFIILRGMLAARQIEDASPRAAAIGLFALFGLQAAINISVNISLIPPKGMTLPFVSYGGSSLLGTALTIGFALALVRRRGAKIRWRRTSYD